MSDQKPQPQPQETQATQKPDPAEMAIKEAVNLAERVISNIERDDRSAYLTPTEVLSSFDRATLACNQMYGDRYYPDAQQACVKNMFEEIVKVMKKEKQERAFWE